MIFVLLDDIKLKKLTTTPVDLETRVLKSQPHDMSPACVFFYERKPKSGRAADRYERRQQDIMQPVWISYPPTEQQSSSDSGTEIFITVSISTCSICPVSLSLMGRQRKRYKQERGRDVERGRERRRTKQLM